MHLPARTEVASARGPGWLGRVLVVVLGLNVGLAWMAIQASFAFAHAVWLLAAGQVLAPAEPGRIAGQIAVLRLLQAVSWLTAAGLFLAWIHRALRTSAALGVRGVPSARDGLGDCLLPGANLVRVPRLVTALWRASAGDRAPSAIHLWVAWWWGVCLFAVVLDLVAVLPGRRFLVAFDPGGGLPVIVPGECLRIAAAVLTIVVVTRIERLQRDRWAAGTVAPGALGA
jgi:hypothetical protein